MSDIENNKTFADRFVTYKALAVNLIGFLLFIFAVGTGYVNAFGERLHPDAVNIREMEAFRADIKQDIADLKASNYREIADLKKAINRIYDMLTKILMDKGP